MSDDDSNDSASVAAQHDVYPRGKLKVAPTDGSTKFNTIRIPLIPVACWRLGDPGFAFDSSFVAPAFRDELTTLSGFVEANPECPAALFGHCDPAGSDALNKTLGDRRVIAIYALLTRQPDLWADLYDKPEVGDRWGLHAVQTMLAVIVGRSTDDQGNPEADPSSTPYYGGAIDGQNGAQTAGAVKAFQSDCGQAASGTADAATRKVLFGAYMDALCTPATAPPASSPDDPPASTPAPAPSSTPPAPFRMQATDFLGGAGAQPGDLPKMSLQGCSKFNPVVLLTSAEMEGYDGTTTRNADDAPNRRVVMFMFGKGTKVDSSVWPCPKVKETVDGCKAAFWSDGDQRRKNGSTKRVYSGTKDTMACRFYDRFARRSPCEIGLTLTVWLQDRQRQRLPSAPYRLTVGGTTRSGSANADGLVTEKGLPFTMQCYVEWGTKSTDPDTGVEIYAYARLLALDVAVDPQQKSLANLAYDTPQRDLSRYDTSDSPSSTDMLAAFQNDYPSSTPQDVNREGTPKKASA